MTGISLAHAGKPDHGRRLYTFTGDSGHSANGNGVAGFVVAKVTTACP